MQATRKVKYEKGKSDMRTNRLRKWRHAQIDYPRHLHDIDYSRQLRSVRALSEWFLKHAGNQIEAFSHWIARFCFFLIQNLSYLSIYPPTYISICVCVCARENGKNTLPCWYYSRKTHNVQTSVCVCIYLYTYILMSIFRIFLSRITVVQSTTSTGNEPALGS